MSKLLKFLTSRVFIVGFLIFLQILLISLFFLFLSWAIVPIFIVFLLGNAIIVLAIINRNGNPMFKVAWIIPVLMFPVCGALFYIMFGRTHLNKKNTEKLRRAIDSGDGLITPNTELLERVGKENAHYMREAKYIIGSSFTNIYEFTETEFLCPGAEFYKKLIPELEKAEHYIFLEYFIISHGKMWDEIHNLLLRKVRSGVEVWLMYDDFGSIGTVPFEFPAELASEGIRVTVFNPFKPSMDKFLNYRDHRKFTIIDGKVAFTGGINLADEYIDEKERFGFWEDCAVMLHGDAVRKITLLYLQMWYFSTGELPDYKRYLINYRSGSDGMVIPFSDEPLFQELVCENAYLNIINDAKHYVYICTPYLILDDVMTAAIVRAAKSGIDIRIVTPRIPDKKTIFLMTRSNYKDLIAAGVRIFEYLPGFMHSKIIVSDDETAIVGTSNFDYRSFYLHFENGVWLYKSKSVMQVKARLLLDIADSEEMTADFFDKLPLRKKLLCSVLKVFAPLF